MRELHQEQEKKKYRVSFVREEYLYTEIYANDEDQAYQIAKEIDYEEFYSKSCDLNWIETEEIEE